MHPIGGTSGSTNAMNNQQEYSDHHTGAMDRQYEQGHNENPNSLQRCACISYYGRRRDETDVFFSAALVKAATCTTSEEQHTSQVKKTRIHLCATGRTM